MKYFLLVAIAALLAGSPAMGFCNVPQPRLVCAEYFASKVVVEATLVKITAILDKADRQSISGHVYRLRADRFIRGQAEEVSRVYEGNDSGRATFGWKTGSKYVLFLFYSDFDKAWELDGCGNSGPVSRASAVMREIAAIQAGNSDEGAIHGMISQGGLSFGMGGVRVEARGKNGLYTAATNAKGEFEIKVPPGEYVVRAIKMGVSFVTADISYENPQKLRIEPGGCAQIQLAAR